MKRKDFLKRLGIGLGVAIVAPKVLAEMPGKEEIQEIDELPLPEDVELVLKDAMANGKLEVSLIKPRRISTHIRVSDVFGDTL